MSTDKYIHLESEDRIYSYWEKNNLFKPKPNKKKFSIVIPPPNVTGSLHMGHALNNSIQDFLIRFHRMNNFETLWQPGTDHAGIATQALVEKKLASENITKNVIGREKFIEKVWEWKKQYGDIIINQLKKLGCSCDWSRNAFTMDENLSNAVIKVFVELLKRKIITQGIRLMKPKHIIRCLTVIFFISHLSISTALYAWDVITAIPTYPQHSQIISAYHQGIDNINIFSDQSGMATISNPANLTADAIKNSLSVSVIDEQDQSTKFQPGSIGTGWKLAPNLGIGLAYSGHMVEQASPKIRLNDESGKTGLDGLNVGYEDIHSEGGRHWLLAGIGYQLSENHRIGLSTGYVFGDLEKTAQFILYEDASSSTVVNTYSQTNKHRYRVVPLVFGYSGDFTDQWNFSLRFMTPFSETVTIHSQLNDGDTVVFESDGYEKESHVLAHDSEFELGAKFSMNDLTRFFLTVGVHDNVFCRSSGVWMTFAADGEDVHICAFEPLHQIVAEGIVNIDYRTGTVL